MKLSLSFVTLALASLALASPAKRAPALSVDIAAPKSVESVEDVKITAKITNTGSQAVKVLKYGSVLDSSNPTRSFVVSKDGKETAFTGIKLQLDMDSLGSDAFTVIPAGETVTVEHDVASLYDFAAAGAGTFSFEPVSTFQVMENDERTSFELPSQKVEVTVEKDVAKRELKPHAKRARLSCSNSSQSSFISSSYSEAKTLASVAANYVSSRGASDALYRAYFKSAATSTVINVFNRVATESSTSRTLNCADPLGACTSGVIAYTVISTTNIYFCSPFYSEVTTSGLCGGTSVNSRNIRGGTTLHEITHATSGTDDITYGCPQDQALSQANSVANADSYNCFATQVYANTQC